MSSQLNLFKKYLISFLLIFMIPVSCIIATLFSVGYDIFSKELFSKEITNIELSMSHLNNELDECLLIAHHLTNKDEFKPFNLNETPSEGSRLINTLFNYIISNKLLNEAAVYFYNTDYVYTSKSSLSVENFYEQYSSSTYSPNALKELVETSTDSIFFNDLKYNDTNYFALLVPLSAYYEQIGCSIFLFDQNLLYDSIFASQEDNRQFYFVNTLDLENSLDSFDLSHMPTLNYESLIRSLSTLTKTGDSFSTHSDQYLIYASKPSLSADNLLILSTASHKKVFAPLHTLNLIMLVSLVGAILFSLLCSYYIVKRNFAPLREMNYSLTMLKQDYSKLEREVTQSIPMRQYFLLNQLINGNINNIPDFIENCHSLNMDLTSPYHGIIVVKAQINHFAFDKTIIDTLQSMQQTSLKQSYLIQHIYPNIDIYLVGTEGNIKLSTIVLPQATLYFGSFSRRLSNISKSYINARALSELATSTPELADSIQVLFQDYKAIALQLTTFLQVGDYQKIPELLLQTIQSLEATTLPFSLQKVICIEIMMAFNNYISKQKYSIPYDKLDLVSLFKVESFEELKEIVLEVSSEMLNLIIDFRNDRILEPSITLIKDFIKEHYEDPNLSTEQIALEFSIPTSYLEDYFYKHTSQSLLDYMYHLRIEKSKELLKTTPYTLKIIANQVGFVHISSFISYFKEYEHCTPGHYRSKYHI